MKEFKTGGQLKLKIHLFQVVYDNAEIFDKKIVYYWFFLVLFKGCVEEFTGYVQRRID